MLRGAAISKADILIREASIGILGLMLDSFKSSLTTIVKFPILLILVVGLGECHPSLLCMLQK